MNIRVFRRLMPEKQKAQEAIQQSGGKIYMEIPLIRKFMSQMLSESLKNSSGSNFVTLLA